MKTEHECIDLKCTYWDGDRCTLGFCEPDTLDEPVLIHGTVTEMWTEEEEEEWDQVMNDG